MLYLDTTNKQILKVLYKASRGLEPYTLHKKFLLPPGTLYGALKRLERHEFITFQLDRIYLTETGRKYITGNPELFLNRQEKTLKIPESFKGPMISVDEPYVPKLRELGNSFFSKK
ncbi:MAG: hypothetical protein AB2745_14230 [Candidatus Thiodiazotropha endolucinida]